MGGRAALFLVAGFSIVMLTIGMNYVRVAGLAEDKYSEYFLNTQAHAIAVSGANMAANEIFISPAWNAGYNVNMMGGKLIATVQALAANRIQLTSIGIYNTDTAIVRVVFQPSSFAKFAYYIDQMPSNLYFATGDTVWGPLHANGRLNVAYSPVFNGKVTTQSGLKKSPSYSTPKFNGGYQTGISIPMPTTTNDLKSLAQSGGQYIYDKEVWVTFNANGTVTYKLGSTGTWMTTSASALMPNGVLYVEKGNMHIKGTVSGQYTICCMGSSGYGLGNVFLDDNIVYKVDPKTPGATDMLGIVTENNVYIADTAPNKSDIVINASMMCLKGGFAAEDYQHIGLCGTSYITGGIIEKISQTTGQISQGQLTSGYRLNLKYDERFLVDTPPFFPKTGSYEILSWWE